MIFPANNPTDFVILWHRNTADRQRTKDVRNEYATDIASHFNNAEVSEHHYIKA